MNQILLAGLLAPVVHYARDGKLDIESARAMRYAATVLDRVASFLEARLSVPSNSPTGDDAAVIVEMILERDAGMPMPPVEVT